MTQASKSVDGKAAVARRTKAASRLLNRELSGSTGAARVLEQAFDKSAPLLERVKYCGVLLVPHGRVLLRSRRGPARPGRVGAERALRRRQHAESDARRDPQRASRSSIARQAKLWADDLLPALAAEGVSCRRRSQTAREAELAELERPFPAGDLSGADAARRGARPAFPLHLRPLAQPRRLRPRRRDRGGAARPRQGARGVAAVRRGGQHAASSCRSRMSSPTSSDRSSRRWRSASARPSG